MMMMTLAMTKQITSIYFKGVEKFWSGDIETFLPQKFYLKK